MRDKQGHLVWGVQCLLGENYTMLTNTSRLEGAGNNYSTWLEGVIVEFGPPMWYFGNHIIMGINI